MTTQSRSAQPKPLHAASLDGATTSKHWPVLPLPTKYQFPCMPPPPRRHNSTCNAMEPFMKGTANWRDCTTLPYSVERERVPHCNFLDAYVPLIAGGKRSCRLQA